MNLHGILVCSNAYHMAYAYDMVESRLVLGSDMIHEVLPIPFARMGRFLLWKV